jgi:hypothetical protein
MPRATGAPLARKALRSAVPLFSRRLEEQLWQRQPPRSASRATSSGRHPDAVADGELRADKAEAVDVGQSRAAGAPPRVFGLIGRLQQMHVHRRAGLLGHARGALERGVGEPVEVGGRDLDGGQRCVGPASAQRMEHADLLGEGQGEAFQVGGGRGAQRGGQGCDEFLVGGVDHPVLVAQGEGVARPHPDLGIGAEDRLGPRQNGLGIARRAAVEMLHGGDARGDHLEGRIERVEPRVDVAHRQPLGEPQLQRLVPRAELEGRQADMVVGVDETGDRHAPPPPDLARRGMRAAERVGWADRGDGLALDQESRVGPDLRAGPLRRIR